jgi:hypothetical protein
MEVRLNIFPRVRCIVPNTEEKFQNQREICPNFMTLRMGYSGLIIGQFEGNI